MDALNDFAADDDAQDDQRPPLAKPGQLGDDDSAESLTVEVGAEPEVVETDYDDAIRFDAVFVASDPEDHTFDGEGPFSAGDEVAVLFWSKRLARELQRAGQRSDADTLAGETVRIEGSGTGYDRDYTVELGDN